MLPLLLCLTRSFSLNFFFFENFKQKTDLEGTTFDEIGLRFTSLSSALSISSYSGDSSDEEDDDEEEEEEGGTGAGGGGGGRFGDNSRRRSFPSALAAAEAADAANLEAWRSTFGQHHFWRAELGPAVLLGMSTTRFRSNSNSVHEGEEKQSSLFFSLSAREVFNAFLSHCFFLPSLSLSLSLDQPNIYK